MFNTLGNLQVNPQAGLLFVDFSNGSTLQMTGEAYVDWKHENTWRFPGAERLVRFRVKEVLQQNGALRGRWQFGEYSPFCPAVKEQN